MAEMGFILNGVTLNSLNYTFNLMVFKMPLSPTPILLQKHWRIEKANRCLFNPTANTAELITVTSALSMQGAWVCSLVGEDSACWCGVAKNENEIKTLWGYSFTPFWCLCQKLSLSPLYFNKTLLHKSSERSSLVSGPRLNSSPEAKDPGVCVIQQQTLIVGARLGFFRTR